MFNSNSNKLPHGTFLEIKAGRAVLLPGSTPERAKVVAQEQRGLFAIKETDDHLIHVIWKNIESGAVEEDLIVFPGDAELLHVKECTDGRMYMLKFKISNDRRTYWIQDSDKTIDQDLCTKVNHILNRPALRYRYRSNAHPALQYTRPSSSTLNVFNDGFPLLGGPNQQQLAEVLSFMNNNGVSFWDLRSRINPSSLARYIGTDTSTQESPRRTTTPEPLLIHSPEEADEKSELHSEFSQVSGPVLDDEDIDESSSKQDNNNVDSQMEDEEDSEDD